MKTVSIDLAEKPPTEPLVKPGKEPYYPTLHLEGMALADLPSEGIIKIKYKKTRSEISERDGGQKRYCCTLEVRKIVGMQPNKMVDTPPPKLEAEAALDAIANAILAKGMEEDED